MIQLKSVNHVEDCEWQTGMQTMQSAKSMNRLNCIEDCEWLSGMEMIEIERSRGIHPNCREFSNCPRSMGAPAVAFLIDAEHVFCCCCCCSKIWFLQFCGCCSSGNKPEDEYFPFPRKYILESKMWVVAPSLPDPLPVARIWDVNCLWNAQQNQSLLLSLFLPLFLFLSVFLSLLSV